MHATLLSLLALLCLGLRKFTIAYPAFKHRCSSCTDWLADNLTRCGTAGVAGRRHHMPSSTQPASGDVFAMASVNWLTAAHAAHPAMPQQQQQQQQSAIQMVK